MPVAAVLDCAVEVSAATMTCSAPDTASGDAHVLSSPLVVGGQNLYVTLASSNVSYDAGTGVFQADVTVKNLIPQALGTTDGTSVDAAGVRVFFGSLSGTGGPVTVKNADGTTTFTATNQPYFQYSQMLAPNVTSSARTWQWDVPSSVTSFSFRVGVSAAVQYPDGWIDVRPSSPSVTVGSTVTLVDTVRDVLGREVSAGTSSWSTGDATRATVDGSGVVTGVAAGSAVITASDTVGGQPVSGSTTVTVIGAPTATNDGYPQAVIGNVGINSASIPYSVMSNDACSGCTITAYDATSAHGGTVSMTTSGAGVGQFTYDPPAGYKGSDSFTYTVTNAGGSATATVSLTVSDMIWFVNAGAATNGSGRLSSPFNSLASAVSASAAGDAIFLYESASGYSGNVTLKANQKLIGQDATSTLATLAGITVPTGSNPLPAMNSANGTIARMTGRLTLGSGNTVSGLTLGPVSGSSFGTLTISDAAINGGAATALNLSTGTWSGSVTSISSSGGSNGIALTNISGTVTVSGKSTAGSGGTLSGHSGASILVTNSSASFSRLAVTNDSTNGVSFTGPGAVSIASSSFGSSSLKGGVRVVAGSGTTTLNLTGSRLTNLRTTDGNPVSFVQSVAGSLVKATITGDTILSAAWDDAIFIGPSAGSMRARIENDSIAAASLITPQVNAGTTLSLIVKNNKILYNNWGIGVGSNGAVCLAATGNRFALSGGGTPDILLSANGGGWGFAGTITYEGSGSGQVSPAVVNAAQANVDKGAEIDGTVTFTAVGSCPLP